MAGVEVDEVLRGAIGPVLAKVEEGERYDKEG